MTRALIHFFHELLSSRFISLGPIVYQEITHLYGGRQKAPT